MDYTAPTVNYATPTGVPTWYTLTGVQSVNISRGRQRFQDPTPQSSLTVVLIPATSYTLDLAIGQLIDVRATNADASSCYFSGRITDIQRSYDMPYNSGTNYAPGDRITITATGPTGTVAAAQTAGTSYFTQGCENIISSLASSQFVNMCWPATNGVQAYGQTFTGGLLDIVNGLCRTAQLTVDDCVATGATLYRNPYLITYPTGSSYSNITFTDTGSGYAYTNLEFLSSVQNTLNWVQVTSPGVYTSVYSPASPPWNSLIYNTYNATSTDVSSLAAYLYNMLSGQVAPAPYSIGTTTMASSACMALAELMKYTGPAVNDVITTNAVMGQTVRVVFRGTETFGSVVGINAAFYPDHGSVQLFLSPSLGTPFTLDSVAYGVLDQNRLGYP